MEDSSDSNTHVDELSATSVNVVVIDTQAAPVVAASTSIVADTRITNDVSPLVEPDQYQPIRVEERLWNTRMQDEGCEKTKLPKKNIYAIIDTSYRTERVPIILL